MQSIGGREVRSIAIRSRSTWSLTRCGNDVRLHPLRELTGEGAFSVFPHLYIARIVGEISTLYNAGKLLFR